MQLIDELDVDLALEGHDHVYSCTKSLNFAPKTESFVNAKVEHPDFDYNEDSVKVLKSPKGTTFVIPNTGGTKAYDAIYGYSLEHIKAVRPKLSWLTQAQLEHYDYLFEKGRQPHRSERFKTKHENWRDSSKQNFVVYRITGDRPTGEVYQVSGDLIKGEQRRVTIVDRFEIRK